MNVRLNDWIVQSNLKTHPKMILFILGHHINNKNERLEAFASISDLATKGGMDKATVKRCLNFLEKRVVIQRIRRKNGKRSYATLYRILAPWTLAQSAPTLAQSAPTLAQSAPQTNELTVPLTRKQKTREHANGNGNGNRDRDQAINEKFRAARNGNGNGHGKPPISGGNGNGNGHRPGYHWCDLCAVPHAWFTDDEFDSMSRELACPDFRKKLVRR